MGWKDEVNNITYLGFRVKGSSEFRDFHTALTIPFIAMHIFAAPAESISKPEVQIPSLMDDEDDEDVMDTDLSIPT